MKNWVLFCLVISAPLYPISVAFSPSTPGQPLIFHHKEPPVSPFEQKLFKLLSTCQRELLTEASIRLSEDLLGLVDTHFLPDSKKQEKNLAYLYNRDIRASIALINVKLIDQTMTTFVEITNQMLKDVSNTKLFHKDYQKMQKEVINRYKAKLEKIATKKTAFIQAEAESALEGMVSCLSLYISSTDSLVNGGEAVYSNMVLARQQLIKNLTIFVEATFVLTNSKKCECHEK